jgi:kynurenine formamidase
MTREGTLWLLDQGVKLIGIDAIGFDPPVAYMWKREKLWEAHRVMREREYYHIENLINLDQIPVSHGFTVSALPIRLRGATAAPIRAVAIIED